jgi:peroxiredoxin family protein
MSVDMMKVSEDDMYDDVEAVINATDFMEISAGGQLLFI